MPVIMENFWQLDIWIFKYLTVAKNKFNLIYIWIID